MVGSREAAEEKLREAEGNNALDSYIFGREL